MKPEIKSPEKIYLDLLKIGMPPDHNLMATSHFSWQELLINERILPSLQQLRNIKGCAGDLEVYRAKLFDNNPIAITCGGRSIQHHEQIYKQINAQRAKLKLPPLEVPKNSLHLDYKAVDFTVKGYSYQKAYNMLDEVHFGGLEIRDDGLHLDWRGSIIRFRPGNIILTPHFNWEKHNALFGRKA